MFPTFVVPAIAFALLFQEEPKVAPAADTPATGFLFKTLQVEQETFNYCVYVPPGYTPEKRWPIILFLHGSGERGTDGFLQTEVGIARAIRRDKSRCPAIVVMPQARPGATWVGSMTAVALRCVEKTSMEYNVDPKRVYLTGLSLGGQGAWMIASEHPTKFAALVPICGFIGLKEQTTQNADEIAAKIAKIPIWCFHGDADPAVPVARTRELVEALRRAGATVEYTEIKGGGHDVWEQAYGDSKLWAWMLQQRLP